MYSKSYSYCLHLEKYGNITNIEMLDLKTLLISTVDKAVILFDLNTKIFDY